MKIKLVVHQISSLKDANGTTLQEDVIFTAAPGELVEVSLSLTLREKNVLKSFDEGEFFLVLDPVNVLPV